MDLAGLCTALKTHPASSVPVSELQQKFLLWKAELCAGRLHPAPCPLTWSVTTGARGCCLWGAGKGRQMWTQPRRPVGMTTLQHLGVLALVLSTVCVEHLPTRGSAVTRIHTPTSARERCGPWELGVGKLVCVFRPPAEARAARPGFGYLGFPASGASGKAAQEGGQGGQGGARCFKTQSVGQPRGPCFPWD